MEEDFVPTCVTIRQDQDEFIKNYRKSGKKFKLSKFIQSKLDEFILFIKNYEQFMEKEVIEDDKKTIE